MKNVLEPFPISTPAVCLEPKGVLTLAVLPAGSASKLEGVYLAMSWLGFASTDIPVLSDQTGSVGIGVWLGSTEKSPIAIKSLREPGSFSFRDLETVVRSADQDVIFGIFNNFAYSSVFVLATGSAVLTNEQA